MRVILFSICVFGILTGAACQSPPSSQSQKSTDPKPVKIGENVTDAREPFAVRILPIPPRTQGALTAVVERQGAQNIEEFEFHWVKNGQKMRGEGSVLPRNSFVRGDVVAVTAKSVKSGRTYTSPTVTIVNSPPAIMSYRLLPELVRRDEKVRVEVTAVDPDGDAISYSYIWKRNSHEIPESKDAPSLDISGFRIGDSLDLTVIPRDQWDEGSPLHLPSVTIANSPPRITSTPPKVVGESGIYRYQVTAQDSDGDPVTFSLPSGPPGMTINSTTGLVTWPVSTPKAGEEFLVEIQASDARGATDTQRFPIRAHQRVSQRDQ